MKTLNWSIRLKILLNVRKAKEKNETFAVKALTLSR